MSLYLFNTLTGGKEKFVPAEPGLVRMYVCGPTTYNYIHLGNARPLVVFDSLRRYLEYRGYAVFYVQNFTDIDDKIIHRAREEGVPAEVLAARYIREFFVDADALNVRRASLYPRVSHHIEDIIRAVEDLIRRGYAYAAKGDVYFAVDKFPAYGRLSRRQPEEMMAGARVEIGEDKRNPLDFALWKKARPGEPAWDSPWGLGRPGWHIECSTMALKYLGPSFDIHGGGADLIFPHHENEIAQAEALTGKPFARFWLHNGFITVNQEKMSKSKGNFFLLREILGRFRPQAVRLYLLGTHYRSPLDFADEYLEEAERGYDRLVNARVVLAEALAASGGGDREGVGGPAGEGATPAALELRERVRSLRSKLEAALDDDFNTAHALGVLYELVREINTFVNRGEKGPGTAEALAEAASVLDDLGEGVLGLFGGARQEADGGLVAGLVELILSIRQDARQRKDWATADYLRDRLKELGIILEDTPHGVRWRIRRG
ncbi:cysteine--tRNA ligase [Thermanaeromonas sp. C210]|uniref:cysteine--tRNA ligase n=1 Tax=Thermanaeromonas sp. C210 TaxID=2731925 RepID=UPI00155B64B9|nr:cysteine--tRNA ligase [Thermanaeromonas sp. C210]GFN23135.1 cysteine--tRNA ligase [Thermanaeromonas sp. C210]